jgi:hypothetical protein
VACQRPLPTKNVENRVFSCVQQRKKSLKFVDKMKTGPPWGLNISHASDDFKS